nr:hypothetical protein [Variovorax dokdonensis]
MAAAVVALLAACASDPARLPTGLTKSQALQQLGAPTASFPLAAGERLQYSRMPMGREVTNVDLDASGRVVSVTQELDERYFDKTIQVDRWTRQDVLQTYGPPYEVTQVSSFAGNIWSWRYRQINNPRILYIYIDPQGVVRRYHSADDPTINDRFRW